MGNKTWSDEEIELLENEFKNGKSTHEIAKLLGRSYSHILNKINTLKLRDQDFDMSYFDDINLDQVEKNKEEFKRMRSRLFKQIEGDCANCEETEDLMLHHVVPLVLGGTNKLTNLIKLCGLCHSKAHSSSRDLIKLGMVRAKEQGVKLGRKKVELKMPFHEAYNKCLTGEWSCTQAMKELGASKSVFYRIKTEYEKENPRLHNEDNLGQGGRHGGYYSKTKRKTV